MQLADDADAASARAVDRHDRFERELPSVGHIDDARLDRAGRLIGPRQVIRDRLAEGEFGDRDQMLEEVVVDLADVRIVDRAGCIGP